MIAMMSYKHKFYYLEVSAIKNSVLNENVLRFFIWIDQNITTTFFNLKEIRIICFTLTVWHDESFF